MWHLLISKEAVGGLVVNRKIGLKGDASPLTTGYNPEVEVVREVMNFVAALAEEEEEEEAAIHNLVVVVEEEEVCNIFYLRKETNCVLSYFADFAIKTS